MKKLMIAVLIGILLKMKLYYSLSLAEDNNEFHPFVKDVLKFMFSNKSCIQLFTDETSFSCKLMTLFYKIDTIGTIVNNPPNKIKFKCNNILVVKKQFFIRITSIEAQLIYGNNVLFLFRRWEGYNTWVLQKNAGEMLFRDAEGLVHVAGTRAVFARDQPSDQLVEVNNFTGSWNQMEYEVKDFSGKPLRVATFNCNLFSNFGPLDSHGSPDWIRGVEATIVEEIRKRLNLSLRVIVPPEKNKWGRLVGNHSWDGGILRLIHTGAADVAFCGLWVDRSMLTTGLEMSDEITQECLKFLVPRPGPETTGWLNLFKAFQLEVWISILAVFMMAVGLLYVFALITSSWLPQQTELLNFGNCTFEIITIIITATTNKKVVGALRQLFFSLVVLSFLVNTCFSGGLYSQLTMPKYSEKLDTIEKLLVNNYYWTTSSFPDSTMMFNMENPLEVSWSKKFVLTETWEDTWKMYKKNPKMALVGHHIGNAFNLDESYPADFLRRFEASSVCHNTKSVAYGFRRGSPFVGPINKFIGRFQSAGLILKHLHDVFNIIAASEPYVYEVLEFEKSHLSEHQSLAMKNISGVFSIFITGLIVSMFIFACEMITVKYLR